MHLTPEQAVYSAAFTQALALPTFLRSCSGRISGTVEITFNPPTAEQAAQAKAWAETAVKAWHTAHETPGFERF